MVIIICQNRVFFFIPNSYNGCFCIFCPAVCRFVCPLWPANIDSNDRSTARQKAVRDEILSDWFRRVGILFPGFPMSSLSRGAGSHSCAAAGRARATFFPQREQQQNKNATELEKSKEFRAFNRVEKANRLTSLSPAPAPAPAGNRDIR